MPRVHRPQDAFKYRVSSIFGQDGKVGLLGAMPENVPCAAYPRDRLRVRFPVLLSRRYEATLENVDADLSKFLDAASHYPALCMYIAMQSQLPPA